MPHVVVKLWPGKSEQQKKELAGELTQTIMRTLQLGEETVSVGIEEIPPNDWAEKVYKPEIAAKSATIYKMPGYDPPA